MYLFSCVLYVDCWVDCEFFRVLFWCPSDVGIESGRNFAMLFSVKNGHVERFFPVWHSGAWYLFDYPCFDVRSWGYQLWFHLVELHLSVVLPVFLMVGCFQLMETSTVWWLVLCNLLIFFPVFVYMHTLFFKCDCASVVTHHWDWHEGLLDVIEFICCLWLFR